MSVMLRPGTALLAALLPLFSLTVYLSTTISRAQQAVEFHVSPECWEQPRTYHSGLPGADLLERIHVLNGPADDVEIAEVNKLYSPNNAYWVEVRNPDTGQPGPWNAAIIIDTGNDSRPTVLLENVASHIHPRWINEKLIFIRVGWGRVVFSDIILDAETGSIIYHEQANDGTIAWQQYQSGCHGQCPCASEPEYNQVEPPPSQPGANSLTGLLLLPGIFGSPETGGVIAAAEPVPLPLFAEPDASQAPIGSAHTPTDIDYLEYTYEGAAAQVYQQRAGWYQIGITPATADGRQRAWVQAGMVGEFLPLAGILPKRLAYLNQHWDGFVWSSPDSNQQFPQSQLKQSRDANQREQYSVDIKSARQTARGLWLEVETHSGSACDGAEQTVIDRGWIPAYSQHGELVAWYHSRGC